MKATGAESVEDYLAALPADRGAALSELRELIRLNLPDGYVESINWGMIAYEVPLELSGKTYNNKPLMYAALASQKNHMGLYLCGLYCLPEGKEKFRAAFAASGKKLDMGQACIRFRKIDDLDLPAIALSIASVTPQQLIAASNAAPRKKR